MATLGLAAAMYDQGSWGILTDALHEARSGNGASLMGLANTYADRVPGGGYSGNIMEVIYAVELPRPAGQPRGRDVCGLRGDILEGRADVGPYLAWGSWPAGYGRSRATTRRTRSRPRAATPSSSSARRATATVYEWSKQLRDQLANGVLISLDGDGHTAYTEAASASTTPSTRTTCGTVPEDGLTC